MGVENKCNRINMALGREKASLVIKNAKIINVFTKEIVHSDIAICEDKIVGIGVYSGIIEIDANGKFVCPGLIDSHVHIESTMVVPSEFARAVLPHGTTTIIADPHEIANVCGINGINFMLNQSKLLPLNIYFMMPSCVPATSFENNGATLTADLMRPYVSNNRILGLGEVMDYPSVFNCSHEMLRKIDLFDDKIIDGHSPHVSGKELNAYRAAGVMTDHECSTIEEALERIRLGMYLQIREGSGAKNLQTLVKGLLENHIGFNRCIFCTDDKHLADIEKNGHISYNVKKSIACGVPPIEAICMATINAAQCYKLKKLGAISPGYSADLIILNSLEDFNISKVFYRGKIVFEDGMLKNYLQLKIDDKNVLNTVRLPNITSKNLNICLDTNKAVVIGMTNNGLYTKKNTAEVNVVDGFFCPDNKFSKIAVIERHKGTKNIGLGILSNFGIINGAIASTVAHDSHNLIVVGDNDKDMLIAIEKLNSVNGGYTIVSDGKVLCTLELPIAGLMSNKTCEYVATKLKIMLEQVKILGINKNIDPFITLSFLALPVIPEIRITDQGLFDVNKFEFIKNKPIT